MWICKKHTHEPFKSGVLVEDGQECPFCKINEEVEKLTSYNSGYIVRKAKALLSQIAKAISYIRKRCMQ